MKTITHPAPEHLTEEAKAWWSDVLGSYDLEEHHLKTLRLAAEVWDRGQRARESMDANGEYFVDRFGQPKKRPEVDVARDCSVLFARLVRELGLDLDPPADVRIPRPSGRYR